MTPSELRYRLDLRSDGGWCLLSTSRPASMKYSRTHEVPEWLVPIMNAAKIGGFGVLNAFVGEVIVRFVTDQDHNLIAFTDWRGEPLA